MSNSGILFISLLFLLFYVIMFDIINYNKRVVMSIPRYIQTVKYFSDEIVKTLLSSKVVRL